MNRLEKHVQTLFKPYEKENNHSDLKEEILSNLQSKVSDLIHNGMDQEKAINLSIQDLGSIEYLFDSESKPYYFTYLHRLEWLQTSLLYILIAWIISIPLLLIRMGERLQFLFIFALLVFGLLYIGFLIFKNKQRLEKISAYDMARTKKLTKIVWILWTLFIFVSVSTVFFLQFASNIWFSYMPKIGGPYQFAQIFASFVIPFFSILIPLIVQKNEHLKVKYRYDRKEADLHEHTSF